MKRRIFVKFLVASNTWMRLEIFNVQNFIYPTEEQ